jgi:hypothetical protein
MEELLDRVLEVHGGLAGWSAVSAVTGRVSLNGPF